MNRLYYLAESSFVDTYGDDLWGRFLGKGLQTAVLGILAVFVVLAIIWGCLELFHYFIYTLPNRRKKEQENVVAEESAVTETAEPETADDGELVAAIVAAITAFRAEESAETGVPSGGFRVVSFRKR